MRISCGKLLFAKEHTRHHKEERMSGDEAKAVLRFFDIKEVDAGERHSWRRVVNFAKDCLKAKGEMSALIPCGRMTIEAGEIQPFLEELLSGLGTVSCASQEDPEGISVSFEPHPAPYYP